MTGATVRVANLVKRFHVAGVSVAALDGVSFCVSPARVTGLVGPDGAGKTTLMRLMAVILSPDSGYVRMRGMADERVAVGYMPQRFGLYEDLTVLENLQLYADLQDLSGPERERRFGELLAFTGLGAFRARLAGRLSGGMKQKLGLACTLVQAPKVLLLDEPSVGVDPVSRRELWRIVYSLADEGMTVLWSTAYLDEAERCHEVILLNAGRILASGPPDRLSAGVEGRVFLLRPEPQRKRAALREVQTRPGVLDAIIKGHDLRVLLEEDTDAAALRDLARERGWELTRASPQFEDAFLALLRAQDAGATPMGDEDAIRRPRPPGARSGAATIAAADQPARSRDARPIMEVDDLTRDFGAFRAVDGVSFQVERGEIFGLLGPNGAGKSTTFKMLLGLLPPTGGAARVLGIDLRRAAPLARARFGYMAQKFSLYGNLSVLQNLRFFASAYGLGPRETGRRIEWALAEFELARYSDFNSDDLPLGYKQRLSLACAILHEPGVLFLDEPTSGVDPLVRRSFWDRINAMADAGVTVLVTTHFMDEAEYCDRIGIIYQGGLIALGSPDELKARHASTRRPEPTLEDAFVALIESQEQAA